MAYKKLKIICDADDVLISCNEYALQLLSQVKGQYYNVSRIYGKKAWRDIAGKRKLYIWYFELTEKKRP